MSEDSGRAQAVIKTVHGLGYRFVAELHEDVDGADIDARANGNPSAAVDNPVVGVLPFENLSSDPSFAHMAEGLTSDVITALSKHRWLRVLPRPTSSSYRGHPDAVAQLRADLGVDYAVEGTVRVGDDRLRVTVSLTDASSGTCRWAERYDRRFEDLFDVLDDITDVIVAVIEPEVGMAERERVRRRPHAHLRAWICITSGSPTSSGSPTRTTSRLSVC